MLRFEITPKINEFEIKACKNSKFINLKFKSKFSNAN